MVIYMTLVPVLQLLFGLNTKKKVMKIGKRQKKKQGLKKVVFMQELLT